MKLIVHGTDKNNVQLFAYEVDCGEIDLSRKLDVKAAEARAISEARQKAFLDLPDDEFLRIGYWLCYFATAAYHRDQVTEGSTDGHPDVERAFAAMNHNLARKVPLKSLQDLPLL